MTNAQKENSKVKDVICELEQNGMFETLIRLGIVPTQWYDYSNIYSLFKNEVIRTGSKMQAYENVAIIFNCSSEKIRLVIRRMNEAI